MSGTTDRATIEKAEAELHAEHKQIHVAAAELQTIKDAPKLIQKLTDLHQLLREHFAHEEFPGGLYDRMGACSAQFRHEVRQLAGEHYEVLTTVLSLRKRLWDEGQDGVSDVIQDVGDVVATVRGHEIREHELVTKAKESA